MSWQIIYSSEARQDLRDIHGYIAFKLSEPGTAKIQTQRIMAEIEALDTFPMRYQVYPHEPWSGKGLRYFPVDNYLVFYLPKAETETVFIVRIMYGGRDIKNQL